MIKGCCVWKDDSAGSSSTRNRARCLTWNGFRALKDMQAHGVARRVVQDADQEVEAHHLMKPVRQFMEQCAQIPVRGRSPLCRMNHLVLVLLFGGRRESGVFRYFCALSSGGGSEGFCRGRVIVRMVIVGT